jgi:preprotein translocase subunit SecG
MLGLILGLILVISVLLVLIILAQNSKGGGLSSQFGGSSTSQIMGVKRTGDLLEKLTWGFAIAILALSLSANKLLDKRQVNQGVVSPNIEAAQEKSALQNFTPNLSGDTEDTEATETLEAPDTSTIE